MTDLPAEAVNRLEQLADVARHEIAADLQERPGAGQGLSAAATEALDALRVGYVEAGISGLRAERAVTCWMILRDAPVTRALAEADAGSWHQPGDAAGGLGSR